MKNKNTGLRSTVWAFILAACGKATHQSADAPAPQLRETPRETPKETVTSNGNVSDGNATPLQKPDKTVPDATTPKGTVTEEPPQTDDQTENAAPETTPSDADNAPVPPLVTPSEPPKDPPPQEPAPPATPQEPVKVESETPPPPIIQRAAFTFRPEDIPDTAEPKGLARHLISGKAWVMPHKGPLKLTWAFNEEESLVNYNTAAPRIKKALAEFEAAANIEFIELDSSKVEDAAIEFRFIRDGALSSALPPRDDGSFVQIGSTSYRILVHEIGHALGLKHPFDERDYGWPDDEAYRRGEDSHLTIMSYWLGWRKDAERNVRELMDEKYAGLGRDSGLQQADIDALQFLYGKPNTDWQSPERFFAVSPLDRAIYQPKQDGEWHVIKVDENARTDKAIYNLFDFLGTKGYEKEDISYFEMPLERRDNQFFRFDEDGSVYFKASPNYEEPQDINGGAKFGRNNIYEIEGKAVDFHGIRLAERLGREEPFGVGVSFLVEVVDLPENQPEIV